MSQSPIKDCLRRSLVGHRAKPKQTLSGFDYFPSVPSESKRTASAGARNSKMIRYLICKKKNSPSPFFGQAMASEGGERGSNTYILSYVVTFH